MKTLRLPGLIALPGNRNTMFLEIPTPNGHYSQAVIYEGLIYLSGQLPNDKETALSIEEQAIQGLTNTQNILTAARTSMDRVLKTTVYIADIGLWNRVDRIFGEFFGEHRPARTIVPTGPLHFGFQIEMDAIASLDAQKAIPQHIKEVV